MEFTILNWTRNWEQFDYIAEYARIYLGEPSTLTRESYAEYMRWLSIFHPEMYAILIISALDE